ncbi:hypothetical protein, partial [Bifidobacterium longum]|uniref:hypothetical protein n=1 Tax=Bifidobacterium longum TaxID=216816 RepID=UPI00051698E3
VDPGEDVALEADHAPLVAGIAFKASSTLFLPIRSRVVSGMASYRKKPYAESNSAYGFHESSHRLSVSR